ncbi:hypothetical protein M902_3215 [Bacteriovorax sp. BAL6_X]|uniref:hypothetical protein n=1 Tax=Bacteriovorax sp. BAL6_X TaxID=1201290 RepID=UPI000386E57A|nr:hypothetical protein [Bacteriovorax sp. BAL6_X]EPZ50861.1 hypothetical protein M902_3215 [Bacteriovorax sp. BAL6_X]
MDKFSTSFSKDVLRYNEYMRLILLMFSLIMAQGMVQANADGFIIKKDDVRNKNIKKDYNAYENYINDHGFDTFYDPSIDYSKFSGRVTDKDPTSTVFKIQVESRNVKFLKPSDVVYFNVARNMDNDRCKGHVRASEDKYITIYAKDLEDCWGENSTLRRGTILVFESKTLAARIKEASRYRLSLLAKKRDFTFQLNDVNKFVWGFSQKQVEVAADYDKQILELQRKKDEALNLLLSKKNDQVRLQAELIYKLDKLDQDLDFYRIEKDELYTDRWHLDKDAGLPVYDRPVPIKNSY